VTRNELAKAVARRVGATQAQTRIAVVEVLACLDDALCEGRRIELRGFGTLRPRYYSGYTGRDPRTGDSVEIPAKVMPVFRPSRLLVDRLNDSNGEIR